eukprot:CAMPEP_0206327842 /NCGR_PEP_ID=MMETSP0106_2-20121207/22366_1 /ASSEMBLY_ACC=CAM_ASM_000206 /TAXON_ID=81532 /ORGANISM="Acanthoeca-like sp., Strain 10tr" /LENGTH=131 /DNA_ID=CAMNT_0053760491 /DNA_START=331 /DNA_END=724 /DNA_ORIENTATION=-
MGGSPPSMQIQLLRYDPTLSPSEWPCATRSVMFGNFAVLTTGTPLGASLVCHEQPPDRQLGHVGSEGSTDPPVEQLHFCHPSSIEIQSKPREAREAGLPPTPPTGFVDNRCHLRPHHRIVDVSVEKVPASP